MLVGRHLNDGVFFCGNFRLIADARDGLREGPQLASGAHQLDPYWSFAAVMLRVPSVLKINCTRRETIRMAFHVPTDQSGFFLDVDLRFRLLLRKGIITGIDPIRLNNWLANFVSLEDKYLAAHLLCGLTYRSDAMIKSSFQHLMECELPRVLREHIFEIGIGLCV